MQTEINHIAFYGTLMSKAGARGLKHSPQLTLLGDTTTKGEMFNVGSFPALVRGEEEIKCELYKINDQSVMDSFDRIEGYRNSGAGDLYRREIHSIPVPGTEERVDAWIYIWNQDTNHMNKITSGSWVDR